MKIAFCVLSLLYFGLTIAQNKTLKGQFTGKNLDKSFINVINLNQYKATISQEDGRFKIQAKAGDSILISSIQYSEVKFLVKPEFFEDDIQIPLKLKINELQDVNLYSLGLTGDLAKDAESIKTFDFSQTQLGFPAYVQRFTRAERRLFTASSAQGGIPLDYFINLINGNIKMYKKLIEYERIDKKQSHLYNLFSKEYYTVNLGIPESLIDDFAYYCIENHPEIVKYNQVKDKLMLSELLPSAAQEYLEIKESEKDKTQNLND